MSIFSNIDFGGLQNILYPIIESLGGPDIRGEIADKSVVFAEAADVLESAAALLLMVAEATEDGILTNAEIDAIIAAAPTVQLAVQGLFDAINGAEEATP